MPVNRKLRAFDYLHREESLQRPGGNVTGITNLNRELVLK
jgi:hypothetical protein